VIQVDHKRDVEAPKIKKCKIRMLGDQYSPYDTVDARTPREPGHAIMREDTTSGGPSSHPSSNQSSYHTLMKVTYSNDHHLKRLAKSLPDMLMAVTKRVITGLATM